MDSKEQISVQLDKEEVCRYLGYGAGHRVTGRVSSLLDEYMQEASELIQPKYSYIIRDIERIEESKVSLGDIAFRSRVIAWLMRLCQKAVIFVVTIGELLERKTWQLAREGHVLEAAILDAVGSDGAEKTAAALHNMVREMASAQGVGVSSRFSPGYCDWDIRQQRVVFRALDVQSTGVRLTHSCLMVPRKSVSGLIGIGLGNGDLERWLPCESCKRRNCPGRRKFEKHVAKRTRGRQLQAPF